MRDIHNNRPATEDELKRANCKTGKKKDQNDGKGQKAKFCTSDLMDSNESI